LGESESRLKADFVDCVIFFRGRTLIEAVI
jgi:hypothetical protein